MIDKEIHFKRKQEIDLVIRAGRNAKNLTHRQLGESLNPPRKKEYMCKLERGIVDPPLHVVQQLYDILNQT